MGRPIANQRVLDDEAAESLRYRKSGPATQVTWDRDLPRLGLRVYASGRKRWVLRTVGGGSKSVSTIGRPWPETTADDARALVLAEMGQPTAVPASLCTWRHALRHYLDHHTTRVHEIPAHRAKTIRVMADALRKAAFVDRPIASTTTADMDVFLGTLAHRPSMHNRVRTFCRTLLHYAEVRDDLLGGRVPDPTRASKRLKERERRILLDRDEVKRLLEAAHAYGARTGNLRPWCWLTLTYWQALRGYEALKVAWTDLEPNHWTLQQRKSGRHARQKLYPASLAAIDVLKTLREHGSPWLFPSPKDPSKHHGDSWVFDQLCPADIKRKGATPGCLRRCRASHLRDRGVSLQQIKTLTDHRTEAALLAYLGSPADESWDAMADEL